MAKALKFWNGNTFRDGKQVHVSVCAHSMADACRVLEECGFNGPGVSYVRSHWSPCWGNSMNGVTPERGVWLDRVGSSEPARRVHPIAQVNIHAIREGANHACR